MATAEPHSKPERRTRDRSAGIQLRRRRKEGVDEAGDRRKSRNGFDIAAALELHLDQVTNRRGMIALLESWLQEAKQADPAERNENYVRAVEYAIEVMTASPDPLAAIAVLQRSSD